MDYYILTFPYIIFRDVKFRKVFSGINSIKFLERSLEENWFTKLNKHTDVTI